MDGNAAKAVEDFAQTLMRYYAALRGATSSRLVCYHIEQKLQDYLNKQEELKDEENNR